MTNRGKFYKKVLTSNPIRMNYQLNGTTTIILALKIARENVLGN